MNQNTDSAAVGGADGEADGGTQTTAINERHRQRMERKKALIDAKIAGAQKEIGIIVVNTGNGKGKSSSGFGMVIRALGHGM